eukprot:TRINITY_DN1099_c0_g1_i3.p1 TRINITY_DN1099_c0_g1~~TRINITY_DN1099_c0_g1_i3.p1  ORF type:complete len:440 (-),score=89.22 TRINITY_DN1099_c0_g1_i3:75-1394(-)
MISIIRKKRDGHALSSEEIKFLIEEYTKDKIPDYQVSAFLMATYYKGMNYEELSTLTSSMMNSGKVLDLSNIKGFKIDKHSTGGVGDKISIPLIAIASACGCKIPMIAGRGLGHTGGTIDKLEAISGFQTSLEDELFIKNVNEVGCCLIGQTASIAPADKRLYALRDVTCTVESIPLISSSIMSKKLASGTDGLVLDVKTGSGAFMKSFEDAKKLAETMLGIGKAMNKKMTALITNMNQPLGYAIGNSVEIEESIDILLNKGPEDVRELTLIFAAWMTYLAGESKSIEEAKQKAEATLKDGSALEKFRKMIIAQKGDPACIEDYSKLPHAPFTIPLVFEKEAVPKDKVFYVKSIDTFTIGETAVFLEAGRAAKDSVIDLSVGMRIYKKIGDQIQVGEKIGEIYSNNEQKGKAAVQKICSAFEISEEKMEKQVLVYEILQ